MGGVVGMPEAICLLSGGLDSATALYVARAEAYRPLALTIDYGQLHKKEIESAKQITRHLNIPHEILSFSMPWGGSALLDPEIPIPQNQEVGQIPNQIPVTYVPARNTIFLSLAASFAEARGAEAIFIGANAIDYSGYPDCRPEYFHEFERLLKLGTKRGVEGKSFVIKTPLLGLKKSEIVHLASDLNVPLEWTWSCYLGGEIPCGTCDSCLLRAEGFKAAGMEDPALKKHALSK